MKKREINVCLSPALYSLYSKDNQIVVMIDAIRAGATICTAFMNGVKKIITVSEKKIAEKYLRKDFVVAGERDGRKIENFEYGNSPFNFSKENISGRNLVFTTTNGTRAIELVKETENNNIKLIIGSFINISAVKKYIYKSDMNVLILCSGWKNKVNVEDTLFAGRLTDILTQNKEYDIRESAGIALNFYHYSKPDYLSVILKYSPQLKAKSSILTEDLKYCLTEDITNVVPILVDDELRRNLPEI